MKTFKQLGLNESICTALSSIGYESPTPIQEKTIPEILSKDVDVKAFAQTGTGKTAAFSLPILEKIDYSDNTVQAVILSPTRELAIQIGKNIEEFSQNLAKVKVLTVYGGSNIEEQIRTLKRGVQIVVGTPGRTLDLLKRKALKLSTTKFVVLDEADEMLNMGFKEDLDAIVKYTPKTKQSLLFSATFPKEVEEIASNYLKNPIEISAGQKNTGTANVTHQFYRVTEKTRYLVLKRIVDLYPEVYGIVFCRTRKDTQKIADQLIQDGYNADALHGDLSQSQRDAVMSKFRGRNIQLLIATDVAARGLDVDDLTHVINHKLPDQIENYTHRSGRTGRAGKNGISIILANRNEVVKLKSIERILKQPIEEAQIPSGEEICEKQLMHLLKKVKANSVDTTRVNSFLPRIYEQLEGFDREELIKRFVALEFNTLLHYYENAQDINDIISNDKGSRKKSNINMTRFFINLGRKDRLRPAKLMGLINEQGIGNGVEIGEIDIFDSFSFFEIDVKFTDIIIAAFAKNKPSFNGRKAVIEVTKKDPSSGGRKRKGRGDRKSTRGHRKSDRKSDRKPSGFGRKRRKR
ncbi:MAG: DEAD/DEAH box helicase [Flavobacteriaceae bacterium]|nr:DEAD/DEAH box helicase [Flavobacteriaceae bacterium]|tara:strand:- start:160163 stop:161896 length:1734 start_codon:yes stop_codon:yes gene_type:complete